jgi:cell wall-associated NlpC family hydrolase
LAYQAFMAGAVSCIVAAGATAQEAAAAPARVRVRGIVDGQSFVESARKYVGVPYVLGGSTPRAFDCSGFVKYVFQVHGLDVPRTAHEQSAIGHRPDTGDLQPGDLLFFYGGEGAQHIAIYVGNDSIIHASSTRHRVRVDRLAGTGMQRTWFGQRLIAVRRMFPVEGWFQLPGSLAATSVPWEDPIFGTEPPPLF